MTRSDWRIGMVGLGALGLPMAVNLQRAGYRLQVHTRSRQAEADPGLEGAQPCSSLRSRISLSAGTGALSRSQWPSPASTPHPDKREPAQSCREGSNRQP